MAWKQKLFSNMFLRNMLSDLFGRSAGITKPGGFVPYFQKNSYIPLQVYKSFLKMALSFIGSADVNKYQLAFKCLLSGEWDNSLSCAARLACFIMPLNCTYKEPFGVLFKKRVKTRNISTHVFMLYFQNIAYEIIIPFHREDLSFYNELGFDAYWCPPFFINSSDAKDTPIKYHEYDLASSDLRKGEIEIITFKSDKNDLERITVFNMETGEINKNPGKPESISKLILLKDGAKFSIKNGQLIPV